MSLNCSAEPSRQGNNHGPLEAAKEVRATTVIRRRAHHTRDGHSTARVEGQGTLNVYGWGFDMSITIEPEASERFFANAPRYDSYSCWLSDGNSS
jgi:hypothetical protein